MKHSLLPPLFLIVTILMASCGWRSHNEIPENAHSRSNSPSDPSYAMEENRNPAANGEKIRPIEGNPEDASKPRIGFYNVENFFDTKNDPGKSDEDFTPNGKNRWDDNKYRKKVRNIAKVIHYMGEPGLMGLCEVENESVLRDLVADKQLHNADYRIVHHESPDHRGIDVALLYSSDEYDLIAQDFIPIEFPRDIVTDYTTREILHATFKNKKGEYVHVFVNHWPSRRGGLKESEPKRVYVAGQLRKEVDKIFGKYEDNHVLIMGDFNDEPHNKSVHTTLGAREIPEKPEKEALYDLMNQLEKDGYATHNYRGEWGMLDHIIVSGSLLDGKGAEVGNPKVFNRSWMLYENKKYRQHRPNRTFSGGKYYAGYSDHLPVSVSVAD